MQTFFMSNKVKEMFYKGRGTIQVKCLIAFKGAFLQPKWRGSVRLILKYKLKIRNENKLNLAHDILQMIV
jgi:hypothetical protein